MFRLDEKENSAVAIWDWDQRKLLKADPTVAVVQRKNSTARNILLAMLVLTVLVVPIMVGKKFAPKDRRITGKPSKHGS